ncbi:ADP-ribosylation factor-like protein 6-interacting protein 1 [Belonocnema kinseyi]|uniref:ADP-ribosylation factor-like protein 6-interacting protein 1 n=1 Tax=Belonocnema kinseyi TaxID=2817044 RepID=UPI00143CDBE9|nr:ADP-ribosylation factor-like protein 6-interacting protein 1 [Belonocnema kinseyi]XP_033207121.1 ADP-ribosylation factor-like protein 6-interacting protein 1 [Belonocnema kinseyi]
MTEISCAEKEKYAKQLKRRMECWREIILPLHSVLFWERPWYPGLIVGLVTLFFSLIWILEPAMLTMLAISLLIAALIDYLVPVVSSTFFSANSWTGKKERKLDDICQRLSVTIFRLQNAWNILWNTRNNRPNFYYGSLSIFLLLLAWIGNAVNNLLLIYVIAIFLLLTPGLRYKHRGQSAIKSIYNQVLHRKTS